MSGEDPVGEVVGLSLRLVAIFRHLEGSHHYASVIDEAVEGSLLRKEKLGC